MLLEIIFWFCCAWGTALKNHQCLTGSRKVNKHRNTSWDWQHCIVHHQKRFDNKHAKSSCAPPNRYKAMLCTTRVYVGTELHCEPWLECPLSNTKILLTDIGPPGAPWCTTQVGGAQRRSVVHNVVLYPRPNPYRTLGTHRTCTVHSTFSHNLKSIPYK